MADEAGEVNTTVENNEAGGRRDESEVPDAEADCEYGGGAERSVPAAAAENSWSAPLLSLARKATETISSGVSYAAAPRNPAQGSAANSPTEREPENELNDTSEKLPGTLQLFECLFTF